MRVAIASGKGGTGKTTVATSLAHVAAAKGVRVAYVDCDVEEPNGHIFLRASVERRETVTTLVPHVDTEQCTYCGACADICRFGAIACMGRQMLVFPELCHACGACAWVCPTSAISEVPRGMGVLEVGHAGKVQFVQGTLDVGEAKSPPLIKEVKAAVPPVDLTIIDAPPGTSCPVVEAVRECDLVVLITEPTPFGRHDLNLAIDMAQAMGLACAVVLNRAGYADEDTRRLCDRRGVPIVVEIPDDRRIAEAYSHGALISTMDPALWRLFETLCEAVMRHAHRPAEEGVDA